MNNTIYKSKTDIFCFEKNHHLKSKNDDLEMLADLPAISFVSRCRSKICLAKHNSKFKIKFHHHYVNQRQICDSR